MTPHDGSRASGYPPDLCEFSAPFGNVPDCDRRRLRCGALALVSPAGEPAVNPHKSGGSNRRQSVLSSGTDPQRKAARRARPSHQAASTVRRVLDGKFPAPIQPRDRPRSRESMNGQELTPRRFHSVISAGATFAMPAPERRHRSTTCRRHMRHHIAHHMRHVVPACGGAIGIPQISQWYARLPAGVFTLRLI
jgi:hypothetical protein